MFFSHSKLFDTHTKTFNALYIDHTKHNIYVVLRNCDYFPPIYSWKVNWSFSPYSQELIEPRSTIQI